MPDQPDQDLCYDRAADRPQALTVLKDRRISEDVVPQRRTLQKSGILEYLDRFSREALKNATKYLPPEVPERLPQTHPSGTTRGRRRR